MKRQTAHMAIGAVFVVAVSLFLIFAVDYLWAAQVTVIERLLEFAEVPYKLVVLPTIDLSQGVPVYYTPGGETFSIPVEHRALSTTEALLILLAIGVVGAVVYRLKQVPLPVKVMALFLCVLVGSTVAYTSFISPVPPHDVSKLSIHWQFSGAIILWLIAFLFFFSVFPVQGPLWVKVSWLVGALAFSLLWNVMRVSVVLATLSHLGSTMFLITHYLTGVYVDFIYIVTFYSLALAHMARSRVSEVGW